MGKKIARRGKGLAQLAIARASVQARVRFPRVTSNHGFDFFPFRLAALSSFKVAEHSFVSGQR